LLANWQNDSTENGKGIKMLRISRLDGAAALAALLPALASAQEDGAAIAAKGGKNGAAACVACHGAKGEGNAAAGFPRLAGQGQAYVLAQLAAFASGARQNPVMAPVAKALTDPEKQAVATYFASLPGAPAIALDESSLKPSATGAWLAARGRWDQNLPACVQCHGPGGIGVGAAFPALAGQTAAYITAQLQAFKNKTRPGGPDKLMATVAAKLSDADIKAVSDHFGAGTAAAAPAAPQKGTP
jgi:cytochrome c553